MGESREQSYENHVRRHPPFIFFVLPVLIINVIWSIVLVWHSPGWTQGWWVVVSIALVVLALICRTYALRVQDRVIRLEESLRYQRALTPELLQQAERLTTRQVVALRFAPEDELSSLVWQVVEGNLNKPAEIKKAIKKWRADVERV
jgi:Family of unknown function (DUF6526)